MQVITIISQLVTKYLPVWIVVFAFVAYFFPVLFQPLTHWTGLMLALILFLMGLTIPPASLVYVFKQPKLVLVGVAFKWTMTVLVSIGIGFLFFQNNTDILAGFILAGSVPSATAASLYTFIANGTVILSVTMSVVDTVISPMVTPLILEATIGHLIPIAFLPLIAKMLLIVLLPIVIGLLIQLKLAAVVEKVRPSVRFFSSVTLIMVVLSVVSGSQDLLQANLSLLPILTFVTMLQVLVPMFTGYGFVKWLRFQEADARAILFETGLCNTALAAILAIDHLSFLAAVPAVINMVINLSIGAMVANIFSRRKM